MSVRQTFRQEFILHGTETGKKAGIIAAAGGAILPLTYPRRSRHGGPRLRMTQECVFGAKWDYVAPGRTAFAPAPAP